MDTEKNSASILDEIIGSGDQPKSSLSEIIGDSVADNSAAPKRADAVVNPYDGAIYGGIAGAAYGLANRIFFPAQKPVTSDVLSAMRKLETAEMNLNYFRGNNNVPADIVNKLQQELQVARNEYAQAKTNFGEAPASKPSLVPNADQQARGIQGNIKDTGITGRASQTTYQERTAQIARNERAQRAAIEQLQRQGLVDPSKAYKLTEGVSASTPSGVLVSPEEAAIRNASMESKLSPRRDAISEIQARLSDARKVSNKVGGAEDKVALARIALEQAEKTSPGFLKNFGYALAKSRIPVNTLAGAGTGLSIYDAINSYRQGDPANAISSGIEAGFGGLAMMPFLPAKAVGTAGGLTTAGLKALSDFLGERYSFGTSPEAERAFSPQPPRQQ